MAFLIRFPIRCQALWICAAGDCNPLLFRRHHLPKQWRREPCYGLRNSSYHRNATHAGQQDFRRRSPVRPSSTLTVSGAGLITNLWFLHVIVNRANIVIFSVLSGQSGKVIPVQIILFFFRDFCAPEAHSGGVPSWAGDQRSLTTQHCYRTGEL